MKMTKNTADPASSILNAFRLLAVSVFGLSLLYTSPFSFAGETEAQTKTSVHLFNDDTDGRKVAAVEAMDTRGADTSTLSLRMLAEYPLIDPVQGWQHVRGMNRNSAFQLEALSRLEGRLTSLARDAEGTLVSEGRLIEVLRGDHLGRVRLEDGHFAYDQVLERDVVTGLELRGGPLASGLYSTEIWAYGERRMELRLRADKNGLEILGAKSFAHGDADPARGQFPEDQLPVANEGGGNEEDPEDPVDPDTWAKMDLEQKWTAFHANKEADWTHFLVQESDDAFMEQLCLFELNAFENLHLGQKLKSMNSPRWIRVAAWHNAAPGGHGMSIASAMLYDTNDTAVVRAWFDANPKALDIADLNALHANLLATIEPANKNEALPLFDPAVVYGPWFDANAKSTRKQYDRAITAFVNCGRFDPTYLKRFYHVVRTPSDQLLRRQSAVLACSHLPSSKVPTDDLLALAADATADNRLREAAVLGLRRAHPTSRFAILHDIAAAPEHPAWNAAVSYLGDYGNDYSVHQLAQLKDLGINASAHRMTNVDRINKRLEKRGQRNEHQMIENTVAVFGYLVEAEARELAVADRLQAWLDERMAFCREKKTAKDVPLSNYVFERLEKGQAATHQPEIFARLLAALKESK